MNKTNDGGPAFPELREMYVDGKYLKVQCPGMSLRDWFAGMAMQGMLAADNDCTWEDDLLSIESYRTADAMLKAREETR